MSHEVRKAKIKLDFSNGFTMDPNSSAEDALKAILGAMDAAEVKMAVEYMDGTESDFESGDSEEEEEDNEQ